MVPVCCDESFQSIQKLSQIGFKYNVNYTFALRICITPLKLFSSFTLTG